MIDYVYDGLVSWFENIIMSVFDLVSMQFLDFFSLDLTNYFSYFPIVKSAFSIFVYVGMGFAIALLAGTPLLRMQEKCMMVMKKPPIE